MEYIFPEVIRSVNSIIILIIVGIIIKQIIPAQSWIMLVLSASVMGFSGIIISLFTIIDKKTRKAIVKKVIQIFSSKSRIKGEY